MISNGPVVSQPPQASLGFADGQTRRRILVALAADADEIWTILRALGASGVARRHTGLATGESWRHRHAELVPEFEKRVGLWLRHDNGERVETEAWSVVRKVSEADLVTMRLLTMSRRWMRPAQATALDSAISAGGGAVFAVLAGVPCERAILQWVLRCLRQPLQIHDLDEARLLLPNSDPSER